MKFLILTLLFPLWAQAQVSLAFIEMRSSDGKIVQLEPNGRFAHIAISVGNMWLHSHPYRGVELINQYELQKMGKVEFHTLKYYKKLNLKEISDYLGKPYDPLFSWDDDTYYCSELVGKILNIEPQPMSFDAPIWNKKYEFRKGELGLSPDDIYETVTGAKLK